MIYYVVCMYIGYRRRNLKTNMGPAFKRMAEPELEKMLRLCMLI